MGKKTQNRKGVGSTGAIFNQTSRGSLVGMVAVSRDVKGVRAFVKQASGEERSRQDRDQAV